MGLDMYLYREKLVKSINDSIEYTDKDGAKQKVKLNEDGLGGYNGSIKTECAYWRKANQIHKWFVDNVQNGEDDCKEYYVDRSSLEELLDICKKVKKSCKLIKGKVSNGYRYENGEKIYEFVDGKVIADATVAKELLPTQSGFFFGGTEYDENYMYDIDITIEQLTKILNEDPADWNIQYIYTSSW